MQRRHLLQSLAGTSLALSAGQLWAAGPAQPCFLVVFLRGGYDAANLLVPVSSSFYYEARPTIAVARPSKDANAALPLNADWGLHPALRDSVYPLFQHFTALDAYVLRHLVFGPARFHFYLSHRRDRRHRFAPKPIGIQSK